MRRSLVFTPWLLIAACSSSATPPAPMPVPTPAPTTAGTGSAQVAAPPATGAGSAAGANLPADGGRFAAITAADDGVGGLLGDGASVSTFGGSGSGGGLTAREGSAAPRAARPSLKAGKPTTKGDLDVEIIKRYIKRDIPKLRYCYERALGASPTLAGTVTATFMIAGDGRVSGASAEGVSAKVSACVAGVIKAIAFPKPTGSSVIVTYPFIFAPSDG